VAALRRKEEAIEGSDLWHSVRGELAAEGIRARVLPVERLDDVRVRVAEALADADLPSPVAEDVAGDIARALPETSGSWRSAVIAAVGRPLTQATLTWRGTTRTVAVPPHYAGYAAVPRAVAGRIDELLRPAGFTAAHCEPPLKTLAACSGLARYGRNNVTYVDGLGSWLQLAACVSDAPSPDDAVWGAPQALERCERCTACLRACPTAAIGGERFLLHTERCLTYHNESRAPFPDWLEPSVHHAAVGCLRCQQVCPENGLVDLVEGAPEEFDERETAAILGAEETGDEPGGLDAASREKLARCGLDYAPRIIARNLRTLLET
jgi:epoxyqueuosine reductase